MIASKYVVRLSLFAFAFGSLAVSALGFQPVRPPASRAELSAELVNMSDSQRAVSFEFWLNGCVSGKIKDGSVRDARAAFAECFKIAPPEFSGDAQATN